MGVQLDLEYIRDHPRETTEAVDRCELDIRSLLPFEVGGGSEIPSNLDDSSSRDSIMPIDVFSTVDIELDETSFLTFQVTTNLDPPISLMLVSS